MRLLKIFERRQGTPSRDAQERVSRAQRDLEYQKKKHDESLSTKEKLLSALEENHLADAMFEALQRNRGM